MSYYENLRGVLQTKLDALNRMDEFHAIARAGRTPAPSPVRSHGLGKAGVLGLAMAGIAAVLALRQSADKNSK